MTTTTMPLFAIDTLQFSKRLHKAGLDQKVAEELAEAMKDAHVQSLEGLATKNDIFLVRKDIDLVRKDIDLVRKDFETFGYKLSVGIFGMLVVAVSIIAWLDKIIT